MNRPSQVSSLSVSPPPALGFERAAVLRAVGYKLGRWVDSVIMQRRLGPGDMAPPPEG